MSVEFTVKH